MNIHHFIDIFMTSSLFTLYDVKYHKPKMQLCYRYSMKCLRDNFYYDKIKTTSSIPMG